MVDFLNNLFFSRQYIPHGHCYLWQPGLLWLHVLSDVLIALAYYSIPLLLIYFIRQREDIPFKGIFILFSLFILSCGTTHIMAIWTLWYPSYWISGLIKAITAIVSVLTAFELIPTLPQALALRSPTELETANQALEIEIDNRQQVEEKLRQSLKTLSNFKYALDQSAIVAITDTKGKITYVNDQFCKISQYEREELIDQTHQMINSGYHAQEFFQDLWSTIASGQIWRGEIKNQAKDGSYYWVDTIIVPFRDESRKPLQYLAIRTDITERKQIDQELREFTTQLQRSNQELKNFAYIVSHDLQEPLRKMKSFAQLLARDFPEQFPDNEKAHRYLDYIIDAAERQRTMIQALLNYSRLGRNDSPKVSIDLATVVENVLEDLSLPIAEAQAKVTVSDLPTVQASATQMAQLFLNLIGNGIKFQGEAPPRIWIEAQLQAEEWLISVQDNGIGIKPLYAERIFQIFQRLHSHSKYPGTGIGLAICRKIVENHDGHIWVVSEPGQGSTFYLTLPVSPSPS